MTQNKAAIKQLQDMVTALMAQGALHDTRLTDAAQVMSTNAREIGDAKQWSKKVDGAFDRVVRFVYLLKRLVS